MLNILYHSNILIMRVGLLGIRQLLVVEELVFVVLILVIHLLIV